MIAPLVLLVLVGTVAWIAWLVRYSGLARPLRDRVWARHPAETTWLGRWLHCPYCIAPYPALPAVALTFTATGPWTLTMLWHAVLTWGAVSFAAGYLAYKAGNS